MSGHPHNQVAALKVAISASISLALMIVDFGWLMRDEVKYIWPIPEGFVRPGLPGFIYLLGTSARLAKCTFNVYFTVRMYLGIHTSPSGCRLWFMYQAFVVQSLLVFVEGMLMHRVYALFIHSRLILSILILFALGQTASMAVSARLSFPSAKHTRDNHDDQPGGFIHDLLAISPVTCELDAARRRKGRLPGFGMVRWARYQVIKPSMSGNITYYWLVCVLWVSIGRIVVNHEKIPRDEGEQREGNTWRGTLQLTSQIEMGEITLTLDTQRGSLVGGTPISTLQSSLPTPMTKASQLSPSDCTRNDA
ncbi:hypothetical protein J3R83DRAFT_8717 [Lanmaoa asiatica]|nr:hypothetical protein J3R83DRAFT_8717 [Lanmaoa asiatica]